jgi:hypothetical protein
MRFKIEEGSESGHGCCFSYSIVDTHKPLERFKMSNGELTRQRYACICECPEKEDAKMILNLLNYPE